MANNKNNKEMKIGFGYINKIWSFIVGLAAIVSAVICIYNCCSSLPPTLTIHYNGKVVESGDSCNVIVCVDTTVAGACEQLFPVISNTTSRTAKDFAMTYTMTVDSVKIMPKQSYFNHIRENDSTSTLKYTETSMPPQTTIKEPLGMLKLIGNTGVLKSTAFATHDGAEKPYTFNSYAKFLYVDSKNLDSKQWKSACRHAIMTKEDIPFSPDYIKTDIFYCSLAHGMTFEFDKHLFYTKEEPNMAIADPDSIAFVDPGVEEVIVATLDTPMLSDTIGIISSSYKKNVWAGDSIEMTIANGYENDTTLYAVLQFQNLSTESIEVKYKPVVLKAGENELAFAIDNNQKFIDCTFINEHQYEEFLGGGDLSKKLLNNVITEETARKIFPFIISVILFILSWELYKRSKEDEKDNCYDKMDSENKELTGTDPLSFGSYSEAIKDYDQAIRLKPDDAKAYFNRGCSKGYLGYHSEAIKDFDEVIRLKPDDAEAYYNRGISKAKLGNYSDAIKDLSEATCLKPDFELAFTQRSKCYKQLAEEERDATRKAELLAKADSDKKKAKELNQKQEEEFLKNCSELIKNKDYQYAYILLTRAIDHTPDSAEAYYYRAICDKEIYHRWKALGDINKAIQYNNTFKEAYLYRGSLQMELEDYPKAIKDFNRVIELDPNSIDGYSKRAQTYRLMAKDEKDPARKKELIDLAEIDEQKAKSFS